MFQYIKNKEVAYLGVARLLLHVNSMPLSLQLIPEGATK
jgi:hypothetical protein